MKNKKRKAWLGAIVGGISTVANLLNEKKQIDKYNENLIKQQQLQTQQSALQNAINLTNAYNDTSYIDNFKNKVSFKTGGAVYHDRIKRIKRFKCGGKRK